MKPDWKEKIANAPESFKALNPHLYSEPVARLRPEKSESNVRSEGENSRVETCEECVRFVVVITALRSKLLDEHDNKASACKPLVDQITRALGFRCDSDPRLSWWFHQIKSDTIHGTHVLVKRL